MKTPLLIGAALLAMAPAGSAWADERSATTELTLENGTTITMTATTPAPEGKTFARTGEVALASGRTLSFELSGTCAAPEAPCAYAGSANGPLGATWQFAGTFTRQKDTLDLTADVSGPAGQKFQLHRTVTGKGLLLDTFFQF